MIDVTGRRGRFNPGMVPWIPALAALGMLWAASAQEASAQEAPAPKPRKRMLVPADVGEDHLKARSEAQFATLDQFKTFYFFRFSDSTAESGIRFRHRIVDDAGKDYKMVHYDHGNGIAVADVDSDGLHDIYFMTQVGSNELWRNLGKGKFENVTAAAGLALADRISVTGSFADVDNDGDVDLFVTTVKMGNVLYLNDGKGSFKDVSKAAGVDYAGHSSGAVFFDYDRDGRLDLFVTNVGTYTTDRRGRADYFIGVQKAFSGHLFAERTETSILYRNLGAGEGGTVRFADVSKQTGLVDTSWSGDAAAIDLNRDGYLDLYVLNMQGDDHFYLNVDGRRFEDKSAEYFPTTPWGTMGAEFLDYNNDGLFDLALSDMHSDMSEIIGPEREKLKSRMQWTEQHLQGGDNNVFGNAFYRNLGEDGGKWRLEEVSDAVGTENYWPWGLSAGDLNADGFEDLLITASMNYPFRYGVNSLLLNNRGEKFLDAEFVLGVEPRKDGVTRDWFNLECGGADKDHSHCEGQDGPVTVLGTFGTRSSVLFDLDRDGDLDIVTNEFNSEPLVLISDLSEQTEVHYLEVELTGKASNRDGLGAVVKVIAGDLVITQSNDGKSGYLTHSSLPLYFGLGDHKKVDRVEVEWPSGARQVVSEGIEVGSRLEVVEAAAE